MYGFYCETNSCKFAFTYQGKYSNKGGMRDSCSSIVKSWLTVVASLTLLGLISPQTVLYMLRRFVLNKYWYSHIIFDKGLCTLETSSASINSKVHEKAHHKAFGVERVNTANSSCVQHCHTHPLCMRKWISNHRGKIGLHLHDIGYLVNRSSYEILALVQKRIGERKCSTRRAYVSVGTDSGLLQHLHHIPHFSEVYFNFFSLSLWSCEFTRKCNHELDDQNFQNASHHIAYPITTHRGDAVMTTQSHTIIDKLSIHSTSKQFWSMKEDSSSHSWIKDIVMAVDGFLGVRTIRSSTCDQNEGNNLHRHYDSADTGSVNEEYSEVSIKLMVDGWFLHASDAMVLGSIILKENPCRYQGLLKKRLFSQKDSSMNRLGDVGNSNGDITALRNEEITVGLLDRNTDRKLLNAKEIIGSLSIGNKSLLMSTFTFSDKSLADQVALMRGVDVLLAVHGAGLTNIAWLKPCSILVEVFPYGYYLPHYFGPLAEKVGIIHDEWEASEGETLRKKLLLERPHCAKKFKGIRLKYDNQFKRTNNTEIEKITTYSNFCLEDDLCRSCARGADGLIINLEKLKKNLHELLLKREKCIIGHDLL
jgi:Glycosyltransferase 61